MGWWGGGVGWCEVTDVLASKWAGVLQGCKRCSQPYAMPSPAT